jgi:hypothetical protein
MKRKSKNYKRAGPLYPDKSNEVLDDQKVLLRVDELARQKDVMGLKQLIESVTNFDVDRGEILIQSIKLKHPEMHRLLLKEEGRGYDSYTDQVVDEQTVSQGSKAMKRRTRKARRSPASRSLRARREYGRPSRLSVEDLEGDLDTEVYLDEMDLQEPIELDDYVLELDENEIEPDWLHEQEVEEGYEMPARDLKSLLASRRRRRARRLADGRTMPRRRRRFAEEDDLVIEEGEGEGFDFEELDLDELDLDGLDIGDEDLEGMEDDELEGETCPPGQELKCVPSEDEDEDEKEEDEDEKEEEEAEKEEEDEEEEGEEEKEASASGILVERLYNDHDLVDLKDAEWTLIPFGMKNGQATAEDPHYVLFADGNPVASVHFSDQNLQGHEAMFTRPSYPERIKEGIKRFGVAETFKQIKARYYSATAFKGDVAKHVKADVQKKLEAERREKLAELKDHFLNTTALVLEGSVKNYWGENPLKEALQAHIVSLGVDENRAIDLIEASWKDAASDYFEVVVNKADELMGAHPEVLRHHASEISNMKWRHPGYEPEDDSIPVAGSNQRRGFANVPVATSSHTQQAAPAPVQPTPDPESRPASPSERRAAWKDQLGLNRKFVNATSANFGKFQSRIKK